MLMLFQRYGLIHLDIKPNNLIMLPGFMILIDLGISKFMSDADRFPYCCTAIYASENQRQATQNLSHADDIFSICATVYALEYGLEQYIKEHEEAPPLKTMLERSAVVAEIYNYATRHWCCLNFFDQFPKELTHQSCTKYDCIVVPAPSMASSNESFYASRFFSA